MLVCIAVPETNSSPLKIGHPKRKLVFQPSIFRCELLVSGRVCALFELLPIHCWRTVPDESHIVGKFKPSRLVIYAVYDTYIHPGKLILRQRGTHALCFCFDLFSQ